MEVYDLKLVLAGEAEPIFARLTEEDVERLGRNLNDDRPDFAPYFFVWDVPDGRAAAVSLRDLQLANPIWAGTLRPEPPKPAATDADEDADDPDDDGRIEIRLRGREPLRMGAEHLEYVADLLFYLDTEPEGFLFFYDEDGDRVWVRADQLLYLSIPKWMVDEGRAINDEDDAAHEAVAAAKVAAKAKPAKAKQAKVKRTRKRATDSPAAQPSGPEA